MNPHFMPVGKPAPPRPRKPEALTNSITASGSIASAFSEALYPPWRVYASIVNESFSSQCAERIGVSFVIT